MHRHPGAGSVGDNSCSSYGFALCVCMCEHNCEHACADVLIVCKYSRPLVSGVANGVPDCVVEERQVRGFPNRNTCIYVWVLYAVGFRPG